MKELLRGINTIIFDLGEVIIDLHPEKVISDLSAKWKLPAENIRDIIVNTPYLIEYETGRIGEQEMLLAVQQDFDHQISVAEFEYAWNLMIGDIDPRRKSLLDNLRKNYQVLFLSNTNSMHEKRFDEIAVESFGLSTLSELVDKAYYSHDMGLRKPDLSIYQAVLDEQNLQPEQCIFFDDRRDNIEAARSLNIQAYQVQFPNEILALR